MATNLVFPSMFMEAIYQRRPMQRNYALV
jgi:hypothetical protein